MALRFKSELIQPSIQLGFCHVEFFYMPVILSQFYSEKVSAVFILSTRIDFCTAIAILRSVRSSSDRMSPSHFFVPVAFQELLSTSQGFEFFACARCDRDILVFPVNEDAAFVISSFVVNNFHTFNNLLVSNLVSIRIFFYRRYPLSSAWRDMEFSCVHSANKRAHSEIFRNLA